MMSRELKKHNMTRKKDNSSQWICKTLSAKIEVSVEKKWKMSTDKSWFFLDKRGVLLGVTRTRVRSKYGSKVYVLKTFIGVQK